MIKALTQSTSFCESMDGHLDTAEVSLSHVPLDLVEAYSVSQAQVSGRKRLVRVSFIEQDGNKILMKVSLLGNTIWDLE